MHAILKMILTFSQRNFAIFAEKPVIIKSINILKIEYKSEKISTENIDLFKIFCL